jgi:electron transport complex protein RnfG
MVATVFKDGFKPPAVLTLICVVACVLLVFVYETTYKDNTGVITDGLSAALAEIYGASDGFVIMRTPEGGLIQPDGVTAVIDNGRGGRAYEIIADGYERGGIHLLVGLSESGEVRGVSFIAITETPGLGTKIQDEAFHSQFAGLTLDRLPADAESGNKTRYKAVWGTKEEIGHLEEIRDNKTDDALFVFDAITGATYSSKGVLEAVKTALKADGELRGF